MLTCPDGAFQKLQKYVMEDRAISALSAAISLTADLTISRLDECSPYLRKMVNDFAVTPHMCQSICEASSHCDTMRILVSRKRVVCSRGEEGADALDIRAQTDTETFLQHHLDDFSKVMRHAGEVVESAESFLRGYA